MSIAIKEITSENEFLSVKDIWNNLNATSYNPTIFNTFEWQFNCYKYFKKRDKLFILLVFDNKEIIGIAPLVISNVLRLSFQKIEFIGDDISDILDFIIKKGKEEIVINCIKDYLMKNDNLWDLIDLYPLCHNSKILKYTDIDTKTFLYKEVIDVSPCVFLPDCYDEYIKTLSKKFRFNLKYYLRSLEKLYNVNFGKVKAKDELEKIIKALFHLHGLRWRSKKLPGVLITPSRKKFHSKLASELLKKDELSLYYLSLDGKIVSVLYGFNFQDKFYFYLSGFSPEFAKYGLGNLLINFCIKDAIDKGLKYFDFLKGKENYKYKWNAQDIPLYRVYIGKDKIKSKLLYYLVDTEKKIIKKVKEIITG